MIEYASSKWPNNASESCFESHIVNKSVDTEYQFINLPQRNEIGQLETGVGPLG